VIHAEMTYNTQYFMNFDNQANLYITLSNT